eukprot:1635126-Amphidinium_carterae.1
MAATKRSSSFWKRDEATGHSALQWTMTRKTLHRDNVADAWPLEDKDFPMQSASFANVSCPFESKG